MCTGRCGAPRVLFIRSLVLSEVYRFTGPFSHAEDLSNVDVQGHKQNRQFRKHPPTEAQAGRYVRQPGCCSKGSARQPRGDPGPTIHSPKGVGQWKGPGQGAATSSCTSVSGALQTRCEFKAHAAVRGPNEGTTTVSRTICAEDFIDNVVNEGAIEAVVPLLNGNLPAAGEKASTR